MNFPGPVTIEILITRCSMPQSAGWILVGTRTDFEAKVEQPLGIVRFVARLDTIRQRAKAPRQTVRPAIHEDFIVVARIRFQTRQLNSASVVMVDGCRRRPTGLVK